MAATYPTLALPEVCPQLMLAAIQTAETLAEVPPQAPVLSPIAEIVREGLLRMPKQLPPWLFYDEAGSLLFDRITELPEYYLTRMERELLATHGDEMIAAAADRTGSRFGG